MTKSNQHASSANAGGAVPAEHDDDRAQGLVDATLSVATPTVSPKRVLKQVGLFGRANFVGADGQALHIRVYCGRSIEEGRFNVDDMVSFCGTQFFVDKNPFSFEVDDATDADAGEDVKITDIFGLLCVIIHACTQGSENAKAIISDSVFAAHLGSATSVPPRFEHRV